MRGHKYSALMPQIQDIDARKIPRSSHVSWLVDWPNLSHLLLLPWCTATAGYHTSSDNSNSQQQPKADYRQTSKFLQSASQPRRVKTTKNGIYTWQFKYCIAGKFGRGKVWRNDLFRVEHLAKKVWWINMCVRNSIISLPFKPYIKEFHYYISVNVQ